MNRSFRLTKSTDFERVRRQGTSYAHPLVVLITRPNQLARTRIGVAAGRSTGGAVQRNRAKRRLREAIRPLLPEIQPGWDLVLLARRPLPQAAFQKITETIQTLLHRAHLLPNDNVN